LIWGLLGVLLLALIGGGILLFFLLQPRTNTTTNTTTNPTAVTNNPTSVPSNRTPISEPTRGTAPSGNAGDVVRDFYENLSRSNFGAVLNLVTPDARAQIGSESDLEALWQSEIGQMGGNLQSVSVEDVNVQGDTATVTVSLTYDGGGTKRVEQEVVNSGGRWLLTGNANVLDVQTP
jgi:hypothetical protein